MIISNEEWKKVFINGIETYYLVNKQGQVYSTKNDKILKPYTMKRDGYKTVSIYFNKIYKSVKIHRLVAEAFIPNPENKPQVNHIDGNKLNNLASNLEWVTAKENNDHAWRIGLIHASKHERAKGENNGSNIYSEDQIKEVINLLMKGIDIKTISDITGINRNTVTSVRRYKSWTYLTKDKGIIFPEFYNSRKTYEEFNNIPADYIRNLIFNGYTNNEIYDITKLNKSIKLHKRIIYIRKKRIQTLYNSIKNIKLKDNPDNILIDNINKQLKILNKSKKLSKNEFKEYKKEYEFNKYNELKIIFETDEFDESFIFIGDEEEYKRLKNINNKNMIN